LREPCGAHGFVFEIAAFIDCECCIFVKKMPNVVKESRDDKRFRRVARAHLRRSLEHMLLQREVFAVVSRPEAREQLKNFRNGVIHSALLTGIRTAR
jgi:hypothetical protein